MQKDNIITPSPHVFSLLSQPCPVPKQPDKKKQKCTAKAHPSSSRPSDTTDFGAQINLMLVTSVDNKQNKFTYLSELLKLLDAGPRLVEVVPVVVLSYNQWFFFCRVMKEADRADPDRRQVKPQTTRG